MRTSVIVRTVMGTSKIVENLVTHSNPCFLVLRKAVAMNSTEDSINNRAMMDWPLAVPIGGGTGLGPTSIALEQQIT